MIGLILDHLWQSTLFAAAAGLLTAFLRANSARVRYGIWLSASLKFLFPLVLLTTAGRTISHTLLSPPSIPPIITALGGATEPFSQGAVAMNIVTDVVPVLIPSWDWGNVLALIWFQGFALIVTLWLRHWLHLRSIVRAAIPIAVDAPIQVKSSSTLLEPGLVGIFPTVLLLPAGIADQLSACELDTIVAHEVCHWRRRDNFTAALHMAVEAIFWFYPLVWWLEARLIAERENACDEDVVAAGRDPEIYAGSILKVCKFYVQSPLSCASGVSGADLRARVHAIMENRLIKALSGTKKAMLAGAAVLAIGIPVAAGMVPPPDAYGPIRTTASPGTEAALRTEIEAWEIHRPDTSRLTPGSARLCLDAWDHTQQELKIWGGLKSIRFQHVTPEGADLYSVTFANQLTSWRIAPLGSDGKTDSLEWWIAYARDGGTDPSPSTEAALRKQIEAWQRHRPAIGALNPLLAAATQKQQASIQNLFDYWGTLKSIAFDRTDAKGWDVYQVVFENGRGIASIGPLAPNGKIDALTFARAFNHPGNGPSPGAEQSLRRYIASLQMGSPNYEEMTPQLAAAVRDQFPALRVQIKALGRLKSVRFKSVNPNGMDWFETSFEHGRASWFVAPLTKDGKIPARLHFEFD